MSDRVINAGDDCFENLALLFSAIVVHGTVPDSLYIAQLYQFPKGYRVMRQIDLNFEASLLVRVTVSCPTTKYYVALVTVCFVRASDWS